MAALCENKDMQPPTHRSKSDPTGLSMGFAQKTQTDHPDRIEPQRDRHRQTVLDDVRDVFGDMELDDQI